MSQHGVARRAAWSGRSWPADAGQARERIIDATLGHIARFGVERTTIQAVATAAGVSRPTVYAHFGGREELISAALQRAAANVTERIIAKAARAGSAAEFVVEALVCAHHEFRTDASVSSIAALSTDPRWSAQALSPQMLALARSFLEPLLGYEPHLASELDEITETAVRFLLSLLIYPSETTGNEARLRAYLHRRLVPALGIGAAPDATQHR